MEWTDVLICVYLVCAMAFFYHAGELSGELKKPTYYRHMEWLKREIEKRDVMIERMKRTGRRRREEIKRLKKKLNGNAITMRMDADGNLYWN